jgi:hypothetical protein
LSTQTHLSCIVSNENGAFSGTQVLCATEYISETYELNLLQKIVASALLSALGFGPPTYSASMLAEDFTFESEYFIRR